MNGKHTSGPWVANFNRNTSVDGVAISFEIDGHRRYITSGQSAEHMMLDGPDSDPILAAECEANARRIVAAVNACEGVPIEVLEAGAAGGLPWNFADQIDQRALIHDLLECLEQAVRWHDQLNRFDIERMKAAIARATGSAA